MNTNIPSELPVEASSSDTALSIKPHQGEAMTRLEWKASFALAAIFGLRMFGLFLVLPIIAVFARDLPGGDDPLLVGLALGAYGATQALFHIPWGIISDRIGRKPVIATGLLIFAIGCLIAALAQDVMTLIIGRTIQGVGAISAAVTALAADLSREQHRTKVMAMIGSSIGIVFALSLLLAPLLFSSIGMKGIFILTGLLALAAIALLFTAVPHHLRVEAARVSLGTVLVQRDLVRLNFGVWVLHVMQTSMWMIVPSILIANGLDLGKHWEIYLPALLISFFFLVLAIVIAERYNRSKTVFIIAIILLLLTQGMLATVTGLYGCALALVVFFIGFNIMEAMQPSLISFYAAPGARGAAMGIYNTTQSIGVAMGGILGGLLIKYFGNFAVNALCAGLGIIWLVLASASKISARTSNRTSIKYKE